MFSTSWTTVTWVPEKFRNMNFELNLIYFYFFFSFLAVHTFTLNTMHKYMHLTFSNRAHAHWFTPKTTHMPGTFEKFTCFLFRSNIFVFSCLFSPVRTSYEYLSVWLNDFGVFSLCLVLFCKLGLSLALCIVDLSRERLVSPVELSVYLSSVN